MSESASESVHQSKCIKKRRAQELTVANCVSRLKRAKQLLRKFPQGTVDFMFFSDDKIFTSAPPVNLQNDLVYAPQGIMKRDIAAKRLLRTGPTFSKSVMVSVAISKVGCTQLIFVETGVKVDSTYYHNVLLSQHMLPGIRQLAGEVYVFQQDNAPVHRARLTRRQYATWLNRGSDWLRSGLTSNRPLLTDSISNSCCNLYLCPSFFCSDSIFSIKNEIVILDF